MAAVPQPRPAHSPANARRVGYGLLIALVAGVATLYASAAVSTVPAQDLQAYLAGARDLLAGRPLYTAFLQYSAVDPTLRPAYIYPPVFALAVVPLLWLPLKAVGWVWLLASQLALGASMLVVFRRLRPPLTVILLAVAVTLSIYPLWVDVAQGQANLFVLLLVVLGIDGATGGRAASGAWLGFAGGLKLSPILLLGWLGWERRFRAAGWLLAGAVAATAVGAAVRPGDTGVFVRQVLPALARGTAYYSNQSASGFLARALSQNPYTTPLVAVSWEPVLVAAAAILAAGWWAWRSRLMSNPLARAFAFLPLLPLLSAVTWEHHLVILLPLIWLCLAELAAHGWPAAETVTLAAAVLCLLVLPHFPVGPPYSTPFSRAAHTRNVLVILAANRLLAGTLLLFVAGPWLLRAR